MNQARTSTQEQAFVQALLRRDRGAFEQLMQSCWGAMWRTGRACGLSDAVTEEMIQDTWTAVLHGLPSFEGRSSVRTWVLRICARTAWRIARRERRHLTIELPPDGSTHVDADQFDSRGHWADTVQPWADATPESIAQRKQAMHALEVALADLPDSQRIVVVMRDIDGLDIEEIAEILQISDGNTRVLLHRGRARLRIALATTYSHIS